MYSRSTIFAFLTLVALTSASCICRRELSPTLPPPQNLPNSAQQFTSIFLNLSANVGAIAHQFTMLTGAMFEANAVFHGKAQLTSVKVPVPPQLTDDEAVAYAAYAALTRILSTLPQELVALEQLVVDILGLADKQLLTDFGMPIAEAVETKFPLRDSPPPYTPPNAPSLTSDAMCNVITDPDGWQPICVTPSSGGECVIQMASGREFFNASLVAKDGVQMVDQLIADTPPPPTFDMDFSVLPSKNNEFTNQYRAILRQFGMLNDRRKAIAAGFFGDATILVHRLTLDEVVSRGLNLEMSLRALFTVSAAVRDGTVGSSTVKLTYSLIRPLTLLQCGFRGEMITSWKEPYQGVQTFNNTEETPWRNYIDGPTSSPSYVSGLSTVAGAASQALKRLFTSPVGANCIVVKEGQNIFEPRIVEGDEGFIAGVTDVPNSGSRTVGYSPAEDTTICWSTFQKFGFFMAKSRVFGGVHTPIETREGLRLGRKAANMVFNFLKAKG